MVRLRERTCRRPTRRRRAPPQVMGCGILRLSPGRCGRPVLHHHISALALFCGEQKRGKRAAHAPPSSLFSIYLSHYWFELPTSMTLPLEPLNCTVTDTVAPLGMLPLN